MKQKEKLLKLGYDLWHGDYQKMEFKNGGENGEVPYLYKIINFKKTFDNNKHYAIIYNFAYIGLNGIKEIKKAYREVEKDYKVVMECKE